MRIPGFAFGVMVAAAVAGVLSAPVTAEDAKAAEVLAAARKAIGGTTLEGMRTLAVEASLQRNIGPAQIATEVEILLELPDKYVRSDQAPGPMAGPMTAGFNGDTAIRPANVGFMPGGGMVIRMGPGAPLPSQKLSPEEQARVDQELLRSYRADISRLMLGWLASAHPALSAEYTFAGEAESPDGEAFVVDVKNADGFSARVFIDQQTSLPLMVTYQGPQPRVFTEGGPRRMGGPAGGPAGPTREMTEDERNKAREDAEKRLQALKSQPPQLVEFTLYFDDWREAGGIRFPHSMRRATGGATHEEWTVNKVRVNPKIDPKKFQG